MKSRAWEAAKAAPGARAGGGATHTEGSIRVVSLIRQDVGEQVQTVFPRCSHFAAAARQCGAGRCDLLCLPVIAGKSIVADLHQTRWENTQAEPPEELNRAQGHLLLPTLIAVILVPDSDGLLGKIEGG